jgi:hypothetical protein
VPGGMNASIMLGTHKLVVDTWAEVYDLLKPYADEEFWQFETVTFDPTAIYVIGRVQLKEHYIRIVELANQYPGRIVFSNPAEGSQTIILQLKRLRIYELVREGKILLLTSGDLEPGFNELSTDCYFSNIVEYLENIDASKRSIEVYNKIAKPHSFLFLNGRLRPHRKYLIDCFRNQGLLKIALWSNMQTTVDMPWTSRLQTGSTELMRLLPEYYEIERAIPNLQSATEHDFAKHHLFNNTWGDAIINPQAYVDTYFSVVTETIFDYPYTFRTEKIWKPMIMCHPFVVAANLGYYRDLHRAGFKTFGHLIDESFDTIESPQDRADKLVAVVSDICYNGASSFLTAAEDVCKYNQQHLREHNRREREQLPQNFARYIDERS